MKRANAITDVQGIKVGHAQNDSALTGCTVILCDPGTIGGIDQRGGAPGTRETDLLQPMHLVNEVHAILLAGGSAFGLNAAAGVMRFLEENGVGIETGVAKVPIVPAAILFDLAIGDPYIRPDEEMAYKACMNATSLHPGQGNIGAGMGATAGKVYGMASATKTGIGTSSIEISNGLIVGAIIAVNPFGDVINPASGEIMAGTRTPTNTSMGLQDQSPFIGTLKAMQNLSSHSSSSFPQHNNTIIGVVATNAILNKEEVNKVAQMAHNGIARTINPAHTMFDGDTIFSLATNKIKGDVNLVGAFAAEAVANAIIQAVKSAEGAGGLPSYSTLFQ